MTIRKISVSHGVLRTVCLACFGGALVALPLSSALAEPLLLNKASPASAAASLGKGFGINIYLDKRIDRTRSVSLAVADTDSPHTTLPAIRSLATALNADFRKGFVIVPAVSPLVSAPEMDEAGKGVVLGRGPQNTDAALKAISDAEGATLQISATLPDTVTFSAERLTLREAAREFAAQTHTVWNAAYLLTPHLDRSALPGKVMSYNVAGHPVLETGGEASAAISGAPVMVPDQPLNDGALHSDTYRSAITRRDASAMIKFQNDAGD